MWSCDEWRLLVFSCSNMVTDVKEDQVGLKKKLAPMLAALLKCRLILYELVMLRVTKSICSYHRNKKIERFDSESHGGDTQKTCVCVCVCSRMSWSFWSNQLCNFRANLGKESSAVLNIYFEVRGSVSSKKSKHIYLSKAPNWIGPCQVCLGQRAKRVVRQGFSAVAMKNKRWQW